MTGAPVPPAAAAADRLRIGEWLVDPATNSLSRGAGVVHVEPKAMDVLVLLAGRVGAVVSRQELFAAVWPGVVVGDEALTQSIIKLRRALGDDPKAPIYIETIAKRGYRLKAPVMVIAGMDRTAEGVTRDADGAPRRPSRRRRVVAWAALACCALLIAAAGPVAFERWQPSGPGPLAEPASATPAGVTVTVVPFESIGSGEQAYLARGISEELIVDLARLSGLRVVRDSGAARAEGGPPGARYRILGSVQRDAANVRIHVHLVDTATREQLWAGLYERPFADLFQMQDEIVASLIAVLPAEFSEAERRREATRYTRSVDAYDEFLRGQALFLVRGAAANEEARRYYRKAIAADPQFARAYASLAMTYAMDHRLQPPATARASLERAYQWAETARSIDPDIPQVYWALGFVYAQGRRHDQAIEALRHAIALDGSFADAYALLGGIYTYVGQPAKSVPLLRTAMRLNTDSGYLYYLLLGRAYLFERDTEQAIVNLRAAALRNPADIETRVYLAATLDAAGRAQDARWEADEIRGLAPHFSAAQWLASYPMTDAVQRRQLLDTLSRLGL